VVFARRSRAPISLPRPALVILAREMLESLIVHARTGRELDLAQVGAAVAALVDEKLDKRAKADFLLALAEKGETPGEIAAFARALRDLSSPLPLADDTRKGDLLDVCGTGGDHLGTFNISTTVAIVCSAAGVRVAKHGNRAVTSKSGSADVLIALGVPVETPPQEAAARLHRDGFAFLFAPFYHPAFKAIGPARKLCAETGRRTIFNFLGPLLNPARPTVQLVGVSDPALVEPMAKALQALGTRRALVASGRSPNGGWLDELSVFGANETAEFHQDRGFHRGTWIPEGLPLTPARLEDLAGGGPEESAAKILAVLSGEDRSPAREAVLLNAAAAFMVAERTRTITEGWDLAAETIDSGAAGRKLQDLRRPI
jgi:anthranilate phosphoribosyltransferase